MTIILVEARPKSLAFSCSNLFNLALNRSLKKRYGFSSDRSFLTCCSQFCYKVQSVDEMEN